MGTIWRPADRDLLRDAGAIAAAAVVIGVSFGAIAVASGMPGWLVVVMSLLVFAGGAQFLSVGLLAAGAPVAALFGGLLLNARHVPFGLALASERSSEASDAVGVAGSERSSEASDAVGVAGSERSSEASDAVGGSAGVFGRRWPARLLGSHLMVDEAVAFAMAQTDPRRRRSAYWLTGGALFVAWSVGTTAGVLIGGAVGDPETFGLDAAFPAGLLALLWPSLRDPVARRVAVSGAGVALLTAPLLPAGAPVLLALVGLAAAAPLPRRLRRRPEEART